jgi:DNA-binding CsgD family transcriptional regulator
MAREPPDRVRADLIELVHQDRDARDFSLRAARILSRSVPFDGLCVVTMDPATFLPTGEVVENGLTDAALARIAEIELSEGDVNTFHELARSGRRSARLSEATDGRLDRCVRHRELRGPSGFGDELRTVLVSEAAAWGGLTLLRGSDSDPFCAEDAALVDSMSGYLAEGLRRAVLRTALSREPRPDEGHAGVALLAADNTIVMTDAAADVWLAELGAGKPDTLLPPVVTAVACRARSAANGDAPRLARARVQTASGVWLIVRGSTLEGDGDAQTAVTLEPARPHDLAPLIADAYGLSERERCVTQLVARGLTTGAIAGRLHISQWTVQDHLKSIFEKVDVSTRGELIARVFFEQYAPRLFERAPLGPDGWFEPSPPDEAPAPTNGRSPLSEG